MINKIKVERAKLNMTQEELANKIGVSRQTINSIETNRFIPSSILVLKISRLFNSSVEDLFELEPDD